MRRADLVPELLRHQHRGPVRATASSGPAVGRVNHVHVAGGVIRGRPALASGGQRRSNYLLLRLATRSTTTTARTSIDAAPRPTTQSLCRSSERCGPSAVRVADCTRSVSGPMLQHGVVGEADPTSTRKEYSPGGAFGTRNVRRPSPPAHAS